MTHPELPFPMCMRESLGKYLVWVLAGPRLTAH